MDNCEGCRDMAAIGQDTCAMCSYDEGVLYGEMNRGSRARYRKAVELEIARWTGAMWASAAVATKAGDVDGLTAPTTMRYRRAIARGRRILARLSGGEQEGRV
jgi:hypothetical protein